MGELIDKVESLNKIDVGDHSYFRWKVKKILTDMAEKIEKNESYIDDIFAHLSD